VAEWRQGRAEVFVPLAHPPGEAQADFGQAEVVIAGEPVTAAYFVMTLPHSDAFFVRAYPKECTESFQDGHVHAFEHFGGVPTRISYDNSKIAVAAITGARGGCHCGRRRGIGSSRGGSRWRTRTRCRWSGSTRTTTRCRRRTLTTRSPSSAGWTRCGWCAATTWSRDTGGTGGRSTSPST